MATTLAWYEGMARVPGLVRGLLGVGTALSLGFGAAEWAVGAEGLRAKTEYRALLLHYNSHVRKEGRYLPASESCGCRNVDAPGWSLLRGTLAGESSGVLTDGPGAGRQRF